MKIKKKLREAIKQFVGEEDDIELWENGCIEYCYLVFIVCSRSRCPGKVQFWFVSLFFLVHFYSISFLAKIDNEQRMRDRQERVRQRAGECGREKEQSLLVFRPSTAHLFGFRVHKVNIIAWINIIGKKQVHKTCSFFSSFLLLLFCFFSSRLPRRVILTKLL